MQKINKTLTLANFCFVFTNDFACDFFYPLALTKRNLALQELLLATFETYGSKRKPRGPQPLMFLFLCLPFSNRLCWCFLTHRKHQKARFEAIRSLRLAQPGTSAAQSQGTPGGFFEDR